MNESNKIWGGKYKGFEIAYVMKYDKDYTLWAIKNSAFLLDLIKQEINLNPSKWKIYDKAIKKNKSRRNTFIAGIPIFSP